MTEDSRRLSARLLANDRPGAVALAAYEMTDDGQSVCCRVNAFGKQRFKRAAASRLLAWPKVIDDSHHSGVQAADHLT